MKRALIFGIGGQDGSYLAESLVADGYEVNGCIRSWDTIKGHKYITDLIRPSGGRLYECDVTVPNRIFKALTSAQPDEIYSLAAPSHVGESFHYPSNAVDVIALGTTHLLDAVQRYMPMARVFLAGSLDMYGNGQRWCDSREWEENGFASAGTIERDLARPISPYGAARLAAYHMGRIYRDVHKLHVSTGIMASHESPRRDPKFLTRKVTMAVAAYEKFKREGHKFVHGSLHLGRLDSKRDWTHARDVVRAMRLMTKAEYADDYVIGSGVAREVQEFVVAAFAAAGLNWTDYVKINVASERPVDVKIMCADSSKIREALGWEPTISFDSMVKEMVRNDIELLGAK